MLSATLACFDFSQLLSIALLTCLKRHHIRNSMHFPLKCFSCCQTEQIRAHLSRRQYWASGQVMRWIITNNPNIQRCRQRLIFKRVINNSNVLHLIFFFKSIACKQCKYKDAVNDTFSRKCTTSKSLFQKHYKQSNNANIRTCCLILEKNANYANTQLTINQRPAFVCKMINQQWQC